ncbi:hypothetical protein J2W34_000980 [Variovorax boronicumulans]|uniref:DUF2845 domain-containing protein n=1 Tax=Variovorax boronicumulans TaxID=436515 RepID=UPI0027836EA1|nr:DUF2845 domain-containing protein [Variovorax boronicumulans]MDQ0069206.1 hypothetical protein [Variovorax boronicumulans]
MKRSLLIPAAWLALASVVPAEAQTLNCNRDFAQRGDSKFTILQKCGEPVFKENFCARPDGNKPEVIVNPPSSSLPGGQTVIVNNNRCDQAEEWTYRPGSGQFETMLLFRDGALASIRYGSRIP